MTNTVLKAQIDSQLTNETTPLSITPTKVGVNLKSIVDYADQELAIKQANLVSGTNIKTVNGTTLLGSGNIVISGSSAVKTTDQITQSSSTPVPLTGYINIISYTGGYSYLPVGTYIGQEVIVCTNYATNIQANSSAGVLLMQAYGSPISVIAMTGSQSRRFIYIGLGSGTGGLTDGYWLSELMS